MNFIIGIIAVGALLTGPALAMLGVLSMCFVVVITAIESFKNLLQARK